jgi:hypothetical protein
MLRENKATLLPAIRLLGAASDYDDGRRFRPCTATWQIESCEGALRSARHGLELLTRPELVAALPAATRERLKHSLREHEAQYTAQLDLIVASGQGDPSELCNASYASVASCERAVAADSKAVREQIFPLLNCGQVVPGKFLTAKDAAAEAKRDAEHPESKMLRSMVLTFDGAVRFYQNRLQQETQFLEEAKQAH